MKLNSSNTKVTITSSPLNFLFFFLIYFGLRWVFAAAHWLSLVAVSGGLLFLAVRGLLIAVASLDAENRL